jgi:hypothetical protein
MRFTITREVSGLSAPTMASATIARPLPASDVAYFAVK